MARRRCRHRPTERTQAPPKGGSGKVRSGPTSPVRRIRQSAGGRIRGLRRTTDIARSLIERSRADLTTTIVEERLRKQLSSPSGGSGALETSSECQGYPGCAPTNVTRMLDSWISQIAETSWSTRVRRAVTRFPMRHHRVQAVVIQLLQLRSREQPRRSFSVS